MQADTELLQTALNEKNDEINGLRSGTDDLKGQHMQHTARWEQESARLRQLLVQYKGQEKKERGWRENYSIEFHLQAYEFMCRQAYKRIQLIYIP